MKPVETLQLSEKSWVTLSRLPDDLLEYANDNFETLFSLHPLDRGVVQVWNKDVPCSRFHQSYLKTPVKDDRFSDSSYMFCGSRQASHLDRPLPEAFKPFLEYMQSVDSRYNQVVINWYDTGLAKLPAHSDCEIGMVDQATIACISLGGQRVFRLKKKRQVQDTSPASPSVDIVCTNGLIITMGGDTQKEFRHGVPALPKGPKAPKTMENRRISITFRQYRK